MRKLRIVGVDADASVVECEVPDSGEKYTLALDDRFRAAARGEYLPLGGAERRPVTGTLRPREIQERIRHGSSAEEVASDAGVPLSRIEGFAVPVLLERANAAELAKNAHPMMPDGPALSTLVEKVESAMDRRGIDVDLVKWDAWRDRAGGWVVSTAWPAGLSDDATATWAFILDSHGGSARALDDEAEGVLDPNRATALRTVNAPPATPSGPPPIRAVPPPETSGAVESPNATIPGALTPEAGTISADAFTTGSPGVPTTPERTLETPTGSPAALPPATAPDSRSDTKPESAPESTSEVSRTAPSSPVTKNDDDEAEFLQHPPAEPERRTSRRHPAMPSWEDVLLGVRGKDD